MVSLLTPAEEAELDLVREEAACRKHGMEFLSLPIPDRGVPATAPSLDHLLALVIANLGSGKAVVIHCRQGIGRSALVAASALVSTGEDVTGAFARVERARGRPAKTVCISLFSSPTVVL